MALTHQLGWDPAFIARSPWLWPLCAAAEHLRTFASWPTLETFDALYAARCQAPDLPQLCFRHDAHPKARRAETPIAHDTLYDGRIRLRGEVPTRPENWHDLLNVLCFATFPRSKYALHSRQYAALSQRLGKDATRLPNARTPEQDALTLFDEGGTVVAAGPVAAAALRESTKDTFTETLIACVTAGQARVVPFGHALFEHLVEGVTCPGATARVLPMDSLTPDAALLEAVDIALARRLRDESDFLHPSEAQHLRLQALPDPPR